MSGTNLAATAAFGLGSLAAPLLVLMLTPEAGLVRRTAMMVVAILISIAVVIASDGLLAAVLLR